MSISPHLSPQTPLDKLPSSDPSIPKISSPFTQLVYKNFTMSSHNLTNSQMTRSKTAKGLTWNFRNYEESFPERTLKAIHIIQNQTSLSKLKLILNLKRPFETHLLLSQIKHLPSLKTLELDINGKHISITDNFKTLAIYFPHLRNLTTLNMTFNLRLPDLQSFHRILRSIKTLRNLTNLSITFMCTLNMEDSHLKLLTFHLCRLIQLHSLTLVFDTTRQLTNHSITSLALTLPKLSLLKKVHITLSGFSKIPNMLTSSTILEFFSSFQALKDLTDITLDLERSIVSNETSTDLFSEGFLSLKNSSQIQRISLLFDRNYNIPALENLIPILSRFSSLNILNLSFRSCSLTIIQNSLSKLQDFPSLSSLSLDFSGLQALPSFVTEVASALRPLIDLKNIKLDFSDLKLIQDEEIVMLSDSLARLTSLRYLDINLKGIELLTDKSVESLAGSFKGMGLLKSLSLNLDSVSLIGNQGIEAFARALGILKNLRFLDVNFKGNKNIDHKGLGILVEALTGLSGLFKLCLNFWICEKLIVPSQMYEDLLRLVKDSRSIQEIDMVLPYSKFIIDEIQKIKKIKITKVTYFKNHHLDR